MCIVQNCDTVSPKAHGCQSHQADQDESLHAALSTKTVATIAGITEMKAIGCKSRTIYG